jgi:FixJ family two-component response regulator
MPTIHVVDDDDSFRIGIARVLKAAGYVVEMYPSGTAFVNSDRTSGPGCVLLDMFMPDATGLEIQAMLAQRNDPMPIIFLSGHATVPEAVGAFQGGAIDFLTKPVSKHVLLDAISSAIARDEAARSRRAQVDDVKRIYQTLTARQRAVFEGILQGKLNKQIAADLGIAERTVKAHRAELMKKMRVDSVASLVHLALNLQDSLGHQGDSRPSS